MTFARFGLSDKRRPDSTRPAGTRAREIRGQALHAEATGMSTPGSPGARRGGDRPECRSFGMPLEDSGEGPDIVWRGPERDRSDIP